MKQPLISIIIPVYNTGDKAVKLLNQLVKDAYENLEIICIDDGSQDDSYLLLNEFKRQQKLLGMGRKIVLIRQENAGPAAARNRGLAEARGELIAFIDSDDAVSKKYLREMSKLLLEDKVAVATSGFLYKRIHQKTEKPMFTNEIPERGEEDFKAYMEAGCLDSVVGLAIATRPDCISDAYLDVLKDIETNYGKDIYIELGLQTVNYKTLEKINRGHTMAELIDAVLRIKRYGFNVTVHMILNLPWDTMEDTIEGAKTLSALGVDQVKLHALYLVKNTLMAKWYQEGQFQLISAEEYVDRVIAFLRYLHPDIVLQRLVGRAPEDNTIFTNWSMGWWRVQDLIDQKMTDHDWHQGDLCNYLNGRAVRKFTDPLFALDDQGVNE